MFRPLSTVSLPTTAQVLLKENGFLYCEDVVSHRGVVPEARNILHKWDLHSDGCWQALTAPPLTSQSLDLWQVECTIPRIVTWSKNIDSMLGGGVALQTITELCGAPGSGKTQLSLQICVDVQIPECFGGIGGEAVFIDTSSNFCPRRVREMADSCSNHCQILSESLDSDQRKHSKHFTSNSIMNGIHVVSIHGITQLIAAVKLLPQALEQHSKIKLIVIDSLAFPFNCGESCNTLNRTSYVYRILSDLQTLAVKKCLAVVVTNQLTTRIVKSINTKSELSPALGESMGHRVNCRLLLGRIPGGDVAAILLKGNNQSSSSAKFKITKAGIRDC
ncbi:hypothetical protein ONE63_000267 [Megalurothrips usitatus]|uniref:DNA repair protein RAD51 homolog 3 n=1 Tax=Megalurothrips usitatus TaxID=439358 RepID=A0AAV7XXX0_9NEOP|nr:hypothetical protein ONE63_000267 [Megalurothrips usitatus]